MCSSVVRRAALGQMAWIQILPGHSPASTLVTSLCHSFLLCELGIVLVPGLWGFVRGKWIF